MGNSKTIVCPNCGAVSSNLDNCEYCGSILVKIASVLVPSSEDTMSEMKNLGFGKSAYVSPTILEGVEKCISLSERFNITIVMPLFLEKNPLLFRMEFSYSPKTSCALKLCFNMQHAWGTSLFSIIERSDISEIFEISQNGNWMYGSVVLDNNARTITQFIQYVVGKLYKQTSDIRIGFLATYFNNYKYLFNKNLDGRPIKFVYNYNEDLETYVDYDHYVEFITLKGGHLNQHSLSYVFPYDKALYDILSADSIMRCILRTTEHYAVDVDIFNALDKKAIWSSEESKQKYITRCKEVCSRYYFCKNIFPHAGVQTIENEPKHLPMLGDSCSCGNNVFGFISEDYDPQVYGPIEDYIKKEEDKIRQEAASDVEEIINEMQRRHVVARVGTSKGGCLPVLIPIVIIMGILGYVIF